MKRFVLPLACVLVVLVALGVYLQRRSPHVRQVAAWLPAGTILLEDMPDLHRTEERWPETALAQIIAEPEVQAFLERPLGLIPHRADADKRLDQMRRIDPTHFFLAVTDWSGGGAPKTIVGLAYSGSKEELDAVVGELRKGAQSLWPAGKSDIETYDSGEIETFSTPGFSAALAYRGQWLFIATDTALLKATLDRYERKAGPGDSLAELPAFKNCLQHLPSGPDNVLFLRPALLADKAASLALLVNPMADMHGADSLKKIEAVGLAMKLDGDITRDAAYVIASQPGTPEETALLTKDALKLSSTNTIIAVNERVDGLATVKLPDAKSDPTGMLQLLESDLKVFADRGLGAEQFAQAFGPENGFLLDWPAGVMIPTPLVMLDVRDAAIARKFLDALEALPIAAGLGFTRHDEGGLALYSLPQTGIGFFPLQMTLGLTGKCVIGALNADAVREGARRLNAAEAGLGGTADYKKAEALVPEPTRSFTFVDTKAIFERIYEPFKAVASMGFVPHLSDYVDLAKLPAPATISRHLSPTVSSASMKDGGWLMESAGPVTTSQAVFVTAICAGAAVVPLIEQQMEGQPVSIPGFAKPGGAPGWSLSSPSTTPLSQAGSAMPSAGQASPAPSAPAPVASPSGGIQ